MCLGVRQTQQGFRDRLEGGSCAEGGDETGGEVDKTGCWEGRAVWLFDPATGTVAPPAPRLAGSDSLDEEAEEGVVLVGATGVAVGGAGEAVRGSDPAVSLSLSSVS